MARRDADRRCSETVAVSDQALRGGASFTVAFVAEAHSELGPSGVRVGEARDLEVTGAVELGSGLDEGRRFSVDLDRLHPHPVGGSEPVPAIVKIQARDFIWNLGNSRRCQCWNNATWQLSTNAISISSKSINTV